MAFVSAIPVAAARPASNSSCARAPRMALGGASRVNRRSALRFAAAFGAGLALAGDAIAAEVVDQQERSSLKEDLEGLNYGEAVVEPGPSAADIDVREKRVEEVPEYVKENKEVLVTNEEKFGEMVGEEKAEAERIRKSFKKN